MRRQLSYVGTRKSWGGRNLHERRLGGAKSVPGKVVPGVPWIICGVVISVSGGLVFNVHAKTWFTGDLLNHEEPASCIAGRKVMTFYCASRFVGGQVKTKESQIGINLGLEKRKLQLLIELLLSQIVGTNDIVAVLIADRLLGIDDRVGIAL